MRKTLSVLQKAEYYQRLNSLLFVSHKLHQEINCIFVHLKGRFIQNWLLCHIVSNLCGFISSVELKMRCFEEYPGCFSQYNQSEGELKMSSSNKEKSIRKVARMTQALIPSHLMSYNSFVWRTEQNWGINSLKIFTSVPALWGQIEFFTTPPQKKKVTWFLIEWPRLKCNLI